MARPMATDFYHSMRFFVTAMTAGTADVLGKGAGFVSCTTPDVTLAAVAYREGHYLYTRKYPGIPEMADVEMARGVSKKDTTFWYWLKSAIHGPDEYRADLTIHHYHKSDFAGLPVSGGTLSALVDPASVPGTRQYILHEALPSHHKVAGDLDANTAEVSIMNIGVSYEFFEQIDL